MRAVGDVLGSAPGRRAPRPGLDLSAWSATLERSGEGFWSAPARTPVRFPEDDHAACAELEARSFWFQHRNACLRAVLERYPPGGPLFDVGGGAGLVAQALTQAGHETVLVEPSAAAVELALARGLANVVLSDLDSAGFAPATLPAVALFDVIEHVQDDDGLLRRVSGLLRPGGRLYLTVPAFPFLWSPEDVYAGHFRRYGLPQARAKLSASGLRVEYASYFFLPLVPLVWLARSLAGRLNPVRDSQAVARRQHAAGRHILPLLLATLAPERLALRRGWQIPLGTSALVVATRS